jgi:hypothetical protein
VPADPRQPIGDDLANDGTHSNDQPRQQNEQDGLSYYESPRTFNPIFNLNQQFASS